MGFKNIPDSADWIVESGQLLAPVCLLGWCLPAVNAPLADFGTVKFSKVRYSTASTGKLQALVQKNATQFIATSGKQELTAVGSVLKGSFTIKSKHAGT